MLKGFKDFIMRGNVVDLAVGVTIGAAFTAVVSSFSKSFLEPLIKAIGADSTTLAGTIPLPGKDNFITWGEFVGTLIGFLMTAAVVYFLVVLPMNKLAERRKRGAEPESDAPSEEILLLREIRDALLAERVAAGAEGTPAQRAATEAAKPTESR